MFRFVKERKTQKVKWMLKVHNVKMYVLNMEMLNANI